LLRACYKVTGPDGVQHEPIYMSVVDAAARGIKDGDIVKVFNDRGATLAGARVMKSQHPGVVQLHQNAWFDPADGKNPANLERAGCSNTLTNSAGQGDYARCMPDVSALVEVQKWSGS
jgi:anaerobic selenocysteine-containing dehydrogenase